MKKTLAIVLLAAAGALLCVQEFRRPSPSFPPKEGCLFCHPHMTDPDPSHPLSALGCQCCHLGNAYALSEERAHAGMVRNPGDLRVVDRTCGRPSCHNDNATRVQRSIMATNRGILKTLQDLWPGGGEGGADVSALLTGNGPENLPTDHYRKMCGGCHLWKRRGDGADEIGRRGGGCSDCHVLDEEDTKRGGGEGTRHPKMTTKIPSENCTKCHNRSARIGLSYAGRFESAGYGTPYEGGELSRRRLSGNRFYIDLIADVHYEKAGMACIDCHTGVGLMGDGNRYERMKAQVDITCAACHQPDFSRHRPPKDLTRRLASLNRGVPPPPEGGVAFSKKGTPLYNLQHREGKILFFRKADGHAVEMDSASMARPHHNVPGHRRLACQACHSAWMPQCYGCHVTYRRAEKQRDWLSESVSSGRWHETRSYLRFSTPPLGVLEEADIYPIFSCQVFVSYIDEKNRYRHDRSFSSFNISALDPHTTRKGSRGCQECHGHPKALGLGEGHLYYGKDAWTFRPTYDTAGSGMPVAFPLDALTNLEGTPFIRSADGTTRPFNGEEIERIRWVNACVACHNTYEDAIYRDFSISKKRFFEEDGLTCLGR